ACRNMNGPRRARAVADKWYVIAASVLCVAILATLPVRAAEIRVDARVFIEVQAGGKNCAVQKVKVPCTSAVAYLRDTLKLPPGTEVGVKAGRSAPYQDVKRVLDDVQKSGFVIPVAYLISPKDGKDQ